MHRHTCKAVRVRFGVEPDGKTWCPVDLTEMHSFTSTTTDILPKLQGEVSIQYLSTSQGYLLYNH